LTAREHFICHHLLPKFTIGPGRRKMLNALGSMSMCKRLTARQYEIARRAKSEAWIDARVTKHCEVCGTSMTMTVLATRSKKFCSRTCQYQAKSATMTGTIIPVATLLKMKLSQQKLLNDPILGKALREARGKATRGRPRSEEIKAKIRATLTGRKHSNERIVNIRAGRWPQKKSVEVRPLRHENSNEERA
jgi:hypothetical protein